MLWSKINFQLFCNKPLGSTLALNQSHPYIPPLWPVIVGPNSNPSVSFCDPSSLPRLHNSGHTAASCHSPQSVMHWGRCSPDGKPGLKESKINHYQKRQHDLINPRKCSDFPNGDCFYSFEGEKWNLSLLGSLSLDDITSAQKTNILKHLISGIWTSRYFCAAEPILLSSVAVLPFTHIISYCTVMG